MKGQGVVLRRAKGGLTKAADMVRDKGRYGDDMLVHMNPREFEVFKKQFGPGTINPDTGLPEFFLGDLFSGLGSAFGNADWGSSLINAGLGAGLGYLTGGNAKSALIGGALGGLSPLILGGSGAAGLLGLGGGGFGEASVSDPHAIAGGGGPARPSDLGSGGSGGGLLGGLLGGGSGGGSTLTKALPLLALASAFGGGKKAKAPADYTSQMNANKAQNRPLQNVDFTRTRASMNGFDPANYGYGHQRQFYNDNRLPAVNLAQGGMPAPQGPLSKAKPSRYVEGPGTGRSDEVPARLSKGEFVVDAETVALLGDGSSEAGAKKLDDMRKGIRRHKGAALAKGKFSPGAKAPLSYVAKKGAK